MASRYVFAILAVLALAGCTAAPSLPTASDGSYRLGTGDEIRIIVFSEGELSGNYQIGDSGQISVPLAGWIHAEGLTVKDLEQTVTRQLSTLMVDPNVSIQINRYRPFYILGEVSNPGEYPYAAGMTVLTAIAIGGGFTSRAQKQHVLITRNVDGQPMEGRANRDALVLPGDVVLVRERII